VKAIFLLGSVLRAGGGLTDGSRAKIGGVLGVLISPEIFCPRAEKSSKKIKTPIWTLYFK